MEFRRAKLLAISAALASAMLVSGCGTKAPDLTGEYSVTMNGQTLPVARVSKSGEAYKVAWYANGSWVDEPEPLQALTAGELTKLVTGRVDGILALKSGMPGLTAEAILVVPKGWTQTFPGHGAPDVVFKATTGYVWISPLGLMDISKR